MRCLRLIAAATALAMLGSCATILYPERKGNTGGQIDVGPLILDCLWLIPGLIPGIVALAVDFVTGAIYLGGGKKKSSAIQVGRGGEIAIRRPALQRRTDVELRLVADDGRVLDRDRATWHAGEGRGDGKLKVDLGKAAAVYPEGELVALRLELHVGDRDPAVMHLQMR
jgi:hypothetical protein